MSTDDKDACLSEKQVKQESLGAELQDSFSNEIVEKKKKKSSRKVSFPEEDRIVTQYFEPANPWQNVPSTSRSQLAAEYLECCRRYNTAPIDCVLAQIRELPESAIGGATRAPRLTLAECLLLGAAPADALEAVLRKTQFRRLEIDHAAIDDEGAEAIFDMVEYYESATTISISGPREFGIRGWQAASRMIKKSSQLAELEVTNHPLEAGHAPVLARALHAHTCRLRVLCLQRAQLSGEPLLCLVIALKSNSSLRELRLGDNRLQVADATQLGSLLRFNTRLQLLDLSNNQIQDAGVGNIADALVEQAAQTPPSGAASPLSPHQCPLSGYESRGLAFLVLWNNQLTRNCAHHLSKALRSSASLCVLNVGRNALGTDTVRALKAGGALVSLGLQAARLGPDAARCLADLIRHDTRLQRLDLRDNRLGVQGLQAIQSAMADNTTLTQIDLDDPAESATNLTAEDSEAATVARLTREIRALCRRNEPAAASPERRVHRKISLTCHSSCALKGMQSGDEERRGGASGGRLRSPAPSPAGSPVPSAHSRFSVTRVTPDRDSSTDSCSPSTPTRSNFSPGAGASRFKVVQVSEPPQIQVQSAPDTRKTSSRFSVTRNFDTTYNPSLTPSPPFALAASRSDEAIASSASGSPVVLGYPNPISGSVTSSSDSVIISKTNQKGSNLCDAKNMTDCKIVSDKSDMCTSSDLSSDNETDNKTAKGENNVKCNKMDVNSDKIDVNADKTDVELDKTDVKVEKTNFTVDNIQVTGDKTDVKSDTTDVKIGKNCSKVKSDNDTNYHDKSEQLSHNEEVNVVGNDKVLKTETKLVKNSTDVSETEKVDVQVEVKVKTESVQNVNKPAKVHCDQNVCELSSKEVIIINEKRDDTAMKQIEAITEDLGNLIQEMKGMSTKTAVLTKKEIKVRSDCTQTEVIEVNSKLDTFNDVPVNFIRDSVVLKKNKSESSLDSPDLEVSRLMNKKLVGSPFCDSSSSLEISGSSMESLNALDNHNVQQITKPIIIQESLESDTELDRRKPDHVILSTESSIESNTSEVTPVNSGNFLNMSVSSNESVSPLIFGKNKKIHGSLSSLEASVSSLDSARQEKVMVTSADSGIEYSLQHPSESKDNSSNEGTLTNNSSLKETVKKPEGFQLQETLTSPKRTSSLLDVPALKTKGLDRMRKISWVAPSPSFHIPKQEPEKVEIKLPSHLEKLLSLFQHPASLFSRSSNDEEKKSASNTPPRKDSSLTSSFWSWGSSTEKEKEEVDRDSSEATDSTLSERVQVSFVDESFSKKLDSKTPSTDTENTLSEFQSLPIQGNSETSDISQTDKIDRVTELTTDDNIVQKSLVLSANASSNGNKDASRACDIIDLIKPNDLNKNYETNTLCGDNNKNPEGKDTKIEEIKIDVKLEEPKPELVRPRSFAAVLSSSGSENSLDKQTSPDSGHPVDKLPSKVIRGIKENISPENTLTSSMTNTNTLALELSERQVKNQPIINAVWEITTPLLEKDIKDDARAPIATIEETCDETENIQLDYIDDIKFIDEKNTSIDSGVTSLEGTSEETKKCEGKIETMTSDLGSVDLGKDALSYLIYENLDFEPETETMSDIGGQEGSLAQELKEAEIKENLLDLSPELVIDEVQTSEVFVAIDKKGLRTSPVIPERAKLKKSNSLEDLTLQIEKDSPKTKTIAFKIPETTPRDIPERRTKLRSRSGSSPKSLPESLNKPCPLMKLDSIKKKKKVSSLGKMARDSLLALNMTEDELAEFRRSYKLTSVESLKSLESVSEDANSQSGTSVDSRCRSCLRTSQESLMSLDSITEDCRCSDDCEKSEKPGRSVR